MVFVISGRVTEDVGLESGRLSKEFEAEIDRMLVTQEFVSSAKGVVLFPTILNPAIASMDDNVTNRKDGSVYVAVGLSHSAWMKASSLEKIDLLAENFSTSLKRVSEKRLAPSDRAKLLTFVEEARRILRKNHQN